jgi:hypothetical protein
MSFKESINSIEGKLSVMAKASLQNIPHESRVLPQEWRFIAPFIRSDVSKEWTSGL